VAGKTYQSAGVDIHTGDKFVSNLKEKVRSTFSKGVLSDIGAFGALYDGSFEGIKEPVLVSSVDGVGTKLKVAFLTERHTTVGQDLVNHCVNDIAVLGAQPLFFLDYFATGKLKPQVAEDVLEGMIVACRENGCALIGGETAEMPGFYRDNEYDIAGTMIGVAEKKKIIDGKRIKAGDVVLALPSTGLHTNGFSLARSVLFERFEADDFLDELGMTVGDALLTIHRSYLRPIRAIAELADVHGLAHITGGGIAGNTRRILPAGLTLLINWKGWRRPPIFQIIQQHGNVPENDMREAFNLGVGLVIIVSKRSVSKITALLEQQGEHPFVIGGVGTLSE
jgi:phosphoribosylformylglycinamidine cyclo-ligase